MYTRLCSISASLLAACVLAAPAADEKVDAKNQQQIEDIINRLGAEQFEEREQATKELDNIGVPALEALRKATESPDPEIKKRAAELVLRIEKRLETSKVLSATPVQLSFKDAPVAAVVADLARQTGYNIELADKDKLKDRRLTLDTGKTTFWQALDQLCAEAKLKEQAESPEDLEKKNKEAAVRGLRMLRAQQQQLQPTKIVLVDGKATEATTCYSGAVRIRALPDAQRSNNDLLVNFQVDAEPKVRWSGVPTLTIEKAIDERGQELMVHNDQPANANRGQNIMIINGAVMPQGGQGDGTSLVVPIRFRGAARAPSRIAELKGSVSGPVQTPTKPLITVSDIAKQVGKTVKGDKGGSITINEAARDQAGNYKVKLSLEPPADPNGANNGGVGNVIVGGAGQRVQIVIGANGQAMVVPAGGNGTLELYDAAGKKITQSSGNQGLRGLKNGAIAVEHDLVFRPGKDQQPTKLVYLGTQTSNITLPFTMESK